MAVVEAGGVGYKLSISNTTYDAMPPRHTAPEPPEVKLFTFMAVREDGVELFGFATHEELSSFKLLTGVSGVGPKAAMSILSTFTPEKLAFAICSEDAKAIAKANGVGAKTAARIILELRDKLLKETPREVLIGKDTVGLTAPPAAKGKLGEAKEALMVLGYTQAEALSALSALDPGLALEELIRLALKKLMR